MYALFSFSIYWLVTIDYKKIHLNRQGKPQAESTELMMALFFLSIQWNSHMLSHNRLEENSFEQKWNISSWSRGTYNCISFWIYLNSHMLSHNRIRGNQVEQKKNFSSRTNGTYDHIVFLFKLFRKREPTPVHIDFFSLMKHPPVVWWRILYHRQFESKKTEKQSEQPMFSF